MVLGTLAGFGLLGTRVEESSGGAFAADATLVTPAGPAFSLWSLIYLGLALFFITFIVLACSKLMLGRLQRAEGARS